MIGAISFNNSVVRRDVEVYKKYLVFQKVRSLPEFLLFFILRNYRKAVICKSLHLVELRVEDYCIERCLDIQLIYDFSQNEYSPFNMAILYLLNSM